MKKGVIRIIEVFLSVTIIYLVLNSVQINLFPRYEEPANMYRLHRHAEDVALSICNNQALRYYFTRPSNSTAMPDIDLDWTLPDDLDFRVYLYTNDSGDHKLDFLVNETGDEVKNESMATASCMVSGGAGNPYNTTLSIEVSSCDFYGSNCMPYIYASEDFRLSVGEGQQFTITFDVVFETWHDVKLILEGRHTVSGDTSILVFNGTDMNKEDDHKFSTTEDEEHAFDSTLYLPDFNGDFNATISADVAAFYDHVYLNVTGTLYNRTYAPKKIVVGVWNI